MFDDLTLQRGLFQTVEHKKQISDQVSARTQREDGEWKYQKKSMTGRLVSKPSGDQSSRQKQ